jgi:starch synthase
VFETYAPAALLGAITRALAAFRTPEVWRRIQDTGMRQDFSWGRSAGRYVAAYRRVMNAHTAARAHP